MRLTDILIIILSFAISIQNFRLYRKNNDKFAFILSIMFLLWIPLYIYSWGR
jgi:hypothetical protein